MPSQIHFLSLSFTLSLSLSLSLFLSLCLSLYLFFFLLLSISLSFSLSFSFLMFFSFFSPFHSHSLYFSFTQFTFVLFSRMKFNFLFSNVIPIVFFEFQKKFFVNFFPGGGQGSVSRIKESGFCKRQNWPKRFSCQKSFHQNFFSSLYLKHYDCTLLPTYLGTSVITINWNQSIPITQRCMHKLADRKS